MFFVHFTPVLPGEMKTSEDLIGPSKVQASFIQSFVSFEFVELKVHELLYTHKYFQDFINPKQYLTFSGLHFEAGCTSISFSCVQLPNCARCHAPTQAPPLP